jgi:hypothetical protein
MYCIVQAISMVESPCYCCSGNVTTSNFLFIETIYNMYVTHHFVRNNVYFNKNRLIGRTKVSSHPIKPSGNSDLKRTLCPFLFSSLNFLTDSYVDSIL